MELSFEKPHSLCHVSKQLACLIFFLCINTHFLCLQCALSAFLQPINLMKISKLHMPFEFNRQGCKVFMAVETNEYVKIHKVLFYILICCSSYCIFLHTEWNTLPSHKPLKKSQMAFPFQSIATACENPTLHQNNNNDAVQKIGLIKVDFWSWPWLRGLPSGSTFENKWIMVQQSRAEAWPYGRTWIR